jgi:hypothetical protein
MRAAPGTVITWTLETGTTGLLGTIAAGIYDGDTAVVPLDDANVTNEISDSGVYQAVLTVPATAGTYVLFGSLDGTLDPDQVITEDLVVSTTEADNPDPAGTDLCTLADVKTYLPGYEPNDATDAKLQQLITAESDQFTADSAFEFVAAGAQPAARLFTVYPGWGRRVHVGALANTEELVVKLVDDNGAETDVDTDNITAVYATAYQPTAVWQPITTIEIRTPTFLAGQLVKVTGNWGFPSVPPFVREAVAATVLLRYISDVAETGTTLSDALDNVNIRSLVARRQDALAALDRLQPPVLA